ncbi:hypothetical protein FGO68_gene15404 [Halteria grandinella]|uniref:Uncharacterized protein n=1 Tax=Halteria grandinella TaxID=5974 RepID=A0A8J8P4S7_HALGN|nr:hypothetical protein FGO68_gene15404 [Halteria grandinella]
MHIAISTLVPIVFAQILINYQRGKLQDKARFSSLTENLKEKKLTALLLTPIDLMRTYLTCVILTTIREYPGIQMTIMFYLSVYRQFFIILAQPYELGFQNWLSLFNEWLVSVYIYFMILLTDYNDNQELRIWASYGLLGVTGTYVAVNILIFSSLILFNIIKWFRAKMARRRLLKAKKTYALVDANKQESFEPKERGLRLSGLEDIEISREHPGETPTPKTVPSNIDDQASAKSKIDQKMNVINKMGFISSRVVSRVNSDSTSYPNPQSQQKFEILIDKPPKKKKSRRKSLTKLQKETTQFRYDQSPNQHITSETHHNLMPSSHGFSPPKIIPSPSGVSIISRKLLQVDPKTLQLQSVVEERPPKPSPNHVLEDADRIYYQFND